MTTETQLTDQGRKQVLTTLATTFASRAKFADMKPKTMTYKKRQLEFFVGAAAALQAVGSHDINFICMMLAVGRDIEEFL